MEASMFFKDVHIRFSSVFTGFALISCFPKVSSSSCLVIEMTNPLRQPACHARHEGQVSLSRIAKDMKTYRFSKIYSNSISFLLDAYIVNIFDIF